MKKHYQQLQRYLKPYTQIWSQEIIEQYPNYDASYPKDWIQEIYQLSWEELKKIEFDKDLSVIENNEFKSFLSKGQKLCQIETYKQQLNNDYDHFAFLKIKEKKKHEITILADQIDHFMRHHHLEEMIDIGGGIGNLARLMATYHGLNVTSIDLNKESQETGKKRNEKNSKQGRPLVKFVHSSFDSKDSKLHPHFKEKTLSVGLHTCGPLALEQMKMGIKTKHKGLINFGCCYHKLNPQKETNLSQVAKDSPLGWTLPALTLATRNHAMGNQGDFYHKVKVKTFRYAFHLFLYHELGIEKFISLGNTPIKMYYGDFKTYAEEQLKRIDKDLLLADKAQLFFNQDWVQEHVQKTIKLGTLRVFFGKPLEVALLLDRALWLEENQYQVQLNEYFNERISPRNIGLTAIIQNS